MLNGVDAGRAEVGYMVPGLRGSARDRFAGLWNTSPMKAAMRAGNINVLRPYQEIHASAALRKEEWLAMDEVVNKPRREELVGFSDLQSRGLVFNLGNPLGNLTLEWEDHSDVSPATVSMLSGTMSEDDLADHGLRGIPIPMVSKGFTLDERLLAAGRNKGEAIDVTNADEATRQVNLALDDLVFNGSFNYGGYTLYGYTEHPQRNTVAFQNGGNPWTNVATTGATILTDVLLMVQTLYEAKITGPYVLYIPADHWAVLQEDFKTEGDDTIMQRLLKLEGLEAIRVSFALTNEIVLTAMQRSVVDAVIGFTPTLVQWEDHGGAVNRFRVIAIMVPRVKRDNDATSGVVHMS